MLFIFSAPLSIKHLWQLKTVILMHQCLIHIVQLFRLVMLNIQVGLNEGKSAAIFCRQVAAWLPNMFCTFHLEKITKLLKTQQSLKPEKK